MLAVIMMKLASELRIKKRTHSSSNLGLGLCRIFLCELNAAMEHPIITTIDISESIPSSETFSPQTSTEVNPLTPDEYADEPLNPVHFSSNEEAIDIEAYQKLQGNGSHHFNARWQVQKSQRRGRNGPYNNQNDNVIKWEQTHKHREQSVHSGNI
ncbi:hypothetical protein Tco_1075779 [Tanacetum coccineum]